MKRSVDLTLRDVLAACGPSGNGSLQVSMGSPVSVQLGLWLPSDEYGGRPVLQGQFDFRIGGSHDPVAFAVRSLLKEAGHGLFLQPGPGARFPEGWYE